MICVLDAGAVLALLNREQGADIVHSLISDESRPCAIHAVNACEVYYDVVRGKGVEAAERFLAALIVSGVEIRDDMDPDFWRQAGTYKARFKRISLADCFGLALAARLGGEFVTTDHHEMDNIAQQGICPVRFVR
jgi:PIN domain nuclease of toxin-antitoxin system